MPSLCHTTKHTWGSCLQAFTNYTSVVDSGLVNQVLYRVWLIARDSLGNTQTALSSVTVKTVRTTPPNFEELLVQWNPPSSVYIEVAFPLLSFYNSSLWLIHDSKNLMRSVE